MRVFYFFFLNLIATTILLYQLSLRYGAKNKQQNDNKEKSQLANYALGKNSADLLCKYVVELTKLSHIQLEFIGFFSEMLISWKRMI